MVVHLSLEYQAHTTPGFEFDSEPHNMPLYGLSLGYPVNAERFPKSARQKGKKKLHDVFPLPGLNAVSERFRQTVEKFEPGVHQFFPVELFDNEGDRIPVNYYIFNCTVSIDAVLAKYSEVKWSKRVVEPYDPFPRLGSWDKETLSAEAIADHHVWCGGLFRTHGIYVSDELFQDLKQKKVSYFKKKTCDVFNVEWLPEENIQKIIDWAEENEISEVGRVARFLHRYV